MEKLLAATSLRNILDSLAYLTTILTAVVLAVVWWSRRRAESRDDALLAEMRADSAKLRASGRGLFVLNPEPGSALYHRCERMVAKRKLARDPFGGYCLPEDAPHDERRPGPETFLS